MCPLSAGRPASHAAGGKPKTALSLRLRWLAVAKDALYVQELEAGLGRLRRVPFGTTGAMRVRLPADGAIITIAVQRRQPSVVFPIE